MGLILQRAAVAALVSCVGLASARPQDSAAPSSPYAGEDFVVEKEHRKLRYEADGTGVIELTSRVRVLSEAGVRVLGQVVKTYNASEERLELRDVRVIKPDGRVVAVPLDGVMERTSPVGQAFPIYTDERQKHLVMPDLRPGDVFEYSAVWTVYAPLAPGQFWYTRSFIDTAVALDEQVEVDVPRERALQVKQPADGTLTVTDKGARRVYLFAHRATDLQRIGKARRDRPRRRDQPAPDVNFSTLRTWSDLGGWYRELERDRRRPTPELRAKAAELTRGLRTDLEKTRAIYDWVATRVRYVSVSLGAAAVQPHPAALTLANGYGDCKDKHTLLAALLEAAGIEADAALISATGEIDTTVPSLQFDHVITVVRLGSETVWLDTTTEVAPFGWLAPPLRGKPALVVGPRDARLVTTPEISPIPSESRLELLARVDDKGTLTATQTETYRGDLEVPVRTAFRVIPREQWTRGIEQWFRSDAVLGVAPQGVELVEDDPAATGSAFSVHVSFNVPGLVKWTDTAPVLRLPEPSREIPDAASLPLVGDGRLFLGGPFRLSVVMRADLPAGWSPVLPAADQVKESFGESSSSYRFEGQTLSIERSLSVSAVTLAADQAEAYDRFRRAVHAQRQHVFSLNPSPSSASRASAAETPAAPDPGDAQAQLTLAESYLGLGQDDKALAALEAAVNAKPEPRTWNNAAWRLAEAGRQLDRAQVWAESAVTSTAARLRTVVPEKMGLPEASLSHSLVRYWDTLGWVHFRAGRVEPALAYVAAAAAALPDEEEVAAHLKQIVARSGASPAPPTPLGPIPIPRPAGCPGACTFDALAGLGTSGTVVMAVATFEPRSFTPVKSAAGVPHSFHFPDATPTLLVLPARLACPASGDCRLEFPALRRIRVQAR